MNLGVALSDLGEFDEAIAWLESSLRLRPDSPEALDNLGMTLARQGKWDEALTWYERALAVRPDFPEAHRNRAYVWLAHGDYERGWPEHEWRLRCRNHRVLPVRPAVGRARTSRAARSCCTPSRARRRPAIHPIRLPRSSGGAPA